MDGARTPPRLAAQLSPTMKPNSLQFNPLLGWVLAANCFAAAARPALAQPDPVTAIPVPAISAQPADQAIAHGANAVFTVSAPGGAMRYQWLKDGLPLADYGNVAGC